jgi:release factor glutamine methyltransferase
VTVGYWLRTATNYLQSKSITTARLDCLVLLEDTMRIQRELLLAEPRTEITDAQVHHLQKLLNRRAQHEPLAYIRGRTEFYGRQFRVTPAVLEPRPESETMIEMLKNLDLFTTYEHTTPVRQVSNPYPSPFQPRVQPSKEAAHEDSTFAASNSTKTEPKVRIADVGTGSGAIGITAKLELPDTQVDLLEIDEDAIELVKTNVDLFTLKLPVKKTDLLEGSDSQYDILLCNLPYVPDSHTINDAAQHEPELAIFGGPDGLDLYRRLFLQIEKLADKPLYILSESLPPQHAALSEIAKTHGYSLDRTEDFIQQYRSELL